MIRMSLLHYVHVYIRIYELAHILQTLTHTHMDTDAQCYTQLYINQNKFMPTNTNMCQYPSIYPHSCILAHIFAHTYTHTDTHKFLHSCTSTYSHVCASANTCTCMQNKNAFIDTTHICTQMHSYANTRP